MIKSEGEGQYFFYTVFRKTPTSSFFHLIYE